MFEPYNLFFKVLDPAEVKLTDPLLKQLQYDDGETKYVVTIKSYEHGLLKHLSKLAKYYELVIYTVMPRSLMEDIFKKVLPHTRALF